MIKKCKLIVNDEVNARFEGLDPTTRRKCNAELKFFIQAARHLPAFKLGRWDGCVSFFAINGNTYVNLLDRVLPIIVDNDYDIELVDNRPEKIFTFQDVTESYIVDNAPNSVWPVKHPAAGQPILLRDYQVEAINHFLNNLQCVSEIATGAGKTLITGTLSHLCETFGRTIVIVPNKSLVKQTEADYLNLGLDVGVYFGDRKDFGKTHTICTWQSLDRIVKNQKTGKGTFTISEFIDGVIAVIVDETHQAKAAVLKELLCGPFSHIPIRWGLTGTVPKEEENFMSILAGIGPVVNRLSAKELMDIDVLAKCHIHIIQMIDTVQYATYHEENNYLVTDKNRLDWISQFILETAKTGNTLILVNRIETGEELEKLIPNSIFVSGGTKMEERKEAYDDIATASNNIIIATYGVAAVGINIPRIFNLMLFEAGKSFVRTIQSIGRGIRKAEDKDFVNIWDIASTCKFSAKHVSERKKIYKNAQYDYLVEKVDYQSQLTTGKIQLLKKA